MSTRPGRKKKTPGGTAGKKSEGTTGTVENSHPATKESQKGSTVGDKDEVSTSIPESGVVPRNTYQGPKNYNPQLLQRFQEYLQKTEVEVAFRNLLKILLNREELPYNPYPGLVTRMRPYDTRFHMELYPSYKILASLRNPLKDTYLPNLHTLRNNEWVWGLATILQVVNPNTLSKYRWLIEDITPDWDDIYSMENYSNQAMVALIGPCVFEGSLYPEAHFVQVRIEFLVTGAEVDKAIGVFVSSVMAEIDKMYDSAYHMIIGVTVPTLISENPEVWEKVFWEPPKIQQNKETFLQKMSDAVIGNRYIYVQCIFQLDPAVHSFVRAEKQYGLNFVQVVSDIKEEGMSSFCEFPMASLHEGVFLNRSQAEVYISIFQPQIDDFSTAEAQPPGSVPGTAASRRSGVHSRLATGQSRTRTALSRNQPLTAVQEEEVSNVQRHVHNRLEKVKPRKVRIDGFRYGDDENSGPYAWQITSPIKSSLQRKIAGYRTEAELFDMVQCIITLALLDRHAFDKKLFVELYRLLHSTAGKVYLLTEQNKGLRAIIQAVAELQPGPGKTEAYGVIRELLAGYRNSINSLFEDDLSERSHVYRTVGKTMIAKISDILNTDQMEFGSLSFIHTTLHTLKNMSFYTVPLRMELAEDSLFHCPTIKGFIKTLKDTFPEDFQRPQTRIRAQPDASKAGENKIEEKVYRHGFEDDQILKHESSVLNVAQCMERDLSIKEITKESVLMKYMIDSHIDEMWNDYLIDLVGGDVFPPNPYPRLITSLRQCATRMDLCNEKPDNALEKLFNSSVKLADPDNFVYNIPGLEAYGSQTSLLLVDTAVYMSISQILKQFTQKNYIQKKGPYRVGICMCLAGPSVWYGQMQPYMNQIILDEHYYIKGPAGCQGEAIQLCAVIVQNHVIELIEKSGVPVMGLYFGESRSRWTWEDLLTKRHGFVIEFCRVCASREPISFMAFVLIDKWRYVQVIKRFKLHFLQDGEEILKGFKVLDLKTWMKYLFSSNIDCYSLYIPELFYEDDPSLFYQSVFLTKERAAFHYQNGGPVNGGNPMSIPNIRAITLYLERRMFGAHFKCNYLKFYHYLLLRDLINQDQTHVLDAWRMFHSISGQIEYVIFLMESLQDLVLICMEYKPYQKLPTESQPVDNKKKKTKVQKESQKEEEPKYKNPVDLKIFSEMVTAIYQKMMFVVVGRITMGPMSFPDYIEDKFKTAVEVDEHTGEIFLAIEDESMFCLEEMKSMVEYLRDTTAADVKSICKEVPVRYHPSPQRTPKMVLDYQNADKPVTSPVQNVEYKGRAPSVHETPSRPGSVTSMLLNDPEQYRSRPAKMQMQRIPE